MTNNPLVSIIVPIYKVENYLDECIQSLIQQTYKNTEIILVDDGSPDNCPKICDNFANTDKRIIVIHKENNGVSEARNTGIEKSSGQYIVFIDGDDILDHNCIQQLVRAHDGNDSTISATGYARFTTASDLFPIVFQDKRQQITPEHLIQKRKGYFCWSCLFPKKLFEKHSLMFPNGIPNLEDVVFLGKTLLFVHNVIYVPAPFYHYRITPASMTSNCINHKWQAISWEKAYRILEEDFQKHNLSAIQTKGYKKLLRRCAYNFYDECIFGKLELKDIQRIKNESNSLNKYSFFHRTIAETYLLTSLIKIKHILDKRG